MSKGFSSLAIIFGAIIVLLIGLLAFRGKALYRLIREKSYQITEQSEQSPITTPYPITNAKDNEHFGNHSFIFSNYSTATKTYLFDSAARTGKKLIRYDFSIATIEPQQGKFTWDKMDENVRMSKERNLSILGTLGYSSKWLAAPSAAKPYQGPVDPEKYEQYSEYVKETVRHYPDVKYWEIWNEPDAKGLYDNNPAEFAKMLKFCYQAVKDTNPSAQVLFPGVIARDGDDWIKQVLTDPNNPGKDNYDIANFHDRGTIKQLKIKTPNIVNIFKTYGESNTPIWITEHGYPADLDYQRDSKYNYGQQAQADYYKESLPLLLSLGIDKVFVTLRDETIDRNGCGKSFDRNQFCSEGLVTFPYSYSSSGKDRPSMAVFQNF